MSEVRVYGTQWCEDTDATRHQLERLGVPYTYHDIDREPEAAEWVKEMNGGQQITPTLSILGEVVAEPDEQELTQVLRSTGLLA